MIEKTPTETGEDEESLAGLVAEIADRIANGEIPDQTEISALGPEGMKAIERLLPTIRLLTQLSGGHNHDHGARSFGRPPEVLGDFRIQREIGRGGIGVVYEATQISLGRRVAVKVLPPSSLLDPRQLRRFETEAQAAALLQHPGIVPVFAYGTEQGVPYFAMRLIDGRNLAEIVGDLRQRNGNGLPPREVAELGRQAAEALDYAHRNEVLHRDIKPSNLLVDNHQRLWIADFGLARIRGDSDLTASGDVLGTLRYLSPEQAKGRRAAVDGRSDVYALGATLYELLTLRPVYEGDDRALLLMKIVSDEPRFSRKLDAAIALDLKTIVLKALAKDPAERYATAGDLAADLTLFLADQPIRARPPNLVTRAIKWSKWNWKAVAAVGLMAGVTLIGVVAAALWSNSQLRVINQRLAEESSRAERHAREAQDFARYAVRHDLGSQLRLASQALEAAQPERAQEILRDIPLNAGGDVRRSFVWRYLWHRAQRAVVMMVGPTPRFGGMALSSDGKWLATSDGLAGVQLWDVDSGTAIREMERVSGRVECPVFSLDGSLVAAPHRTSDAASSDGFSIWEVASGRRLARLPMGRGHDSLACVFLRDGGFSGTANPALTRLWQLTDDPSRARLLNEWNRYTEINSASTGGEFLTLENPLTIFLRDVRTSESMRDFHLPSTENIVATACSRGARVVAAVSHPDWKVTLWDGQTAKVLARHVVPPRVYRLLFSPDGTALAAIDTNESVHLVECGSGMLRRIVPGQSDPLRQIRRINIAFSSDSGRLATAVSGRAKEGDMGQVSIWEKATGRRLATFPGRSEEVESLAFTPDGQSLLISSLAGVRRWRLTAGDNDKDRQPAGHKDEAWSLAFSPDGHTMATGSDDSESDPTIKLWDTATGRLISGWDAGEGTVASLAFSRDGRMLASGHFVSKNNIRIWDAATGRKLTILEGHADHVRSVTFAPDGKTLATASRDETARLWDVSSWHERKVLHGHTDTVNVVAFSPDGDTLASAGNDGDLRLWDMGSIEDANERPVVLHNRSHLMAMAFAPDGKTLSVADDMGSMTVWDLERLTPVRMIHGDGDKLFQLAFTPDGKTLAAAGMNGVISLWDPATGQELLSLPAHRAQINDLAFSPDGSILGSAAHNGSVRLWRAEP